MRKRKNKTHFIQKKKARQAENLKGQPRQKLEPKKKKAYQAENLKGWSRQKLGQKKIFSKKKMMRVSNLTMRQDAKKTKKRKSSS